MKNILVRSLSGLVFVALVLTPLLLEHYFLAVCVYFGFIFLGVLEFYQLFKNHDRVNINALFNALFALLVCVLLLISIHFSETFLLGLTVLISSFLVLLLIELWREKKDPLLNISISVFGFLYACSPLLLLVISIDVGNETIPALFYVGMFSLIWTNDTFAFLVGKFFGKTPLFERISPKKTWEGTLGGVFVSFLLGFFMGTYFFPGFLYFWLGATAIIVFCAIFGDLLESLFKRSLNIKDSGTIMPGHGGILDRLDATLYTIPFFLLYFLLTQTNYFYLN